MLSIDIEKQYGNFHLEMAFEAGTETMGLLGASGCGKSVSLRSIAGIETPDAGKIVVNDTVFFDKARGHRAKVNLTPQQRKSALLFQSYMLFPNLTVEQNVAAGIDKNTSAAERDHIVETELQRFGLAGFNKRYPAQLSGGQQQRVAIARALMNNPPVVFADEPTGNLDTKSSIEIMNLFTELSGEGITIVMVTHEDDIAAYARRHIVMRDGRVMRDDRGEGPLKTTEQVSQLVKEALA